jgi:glutathione S-transferase
MSACAGSASRCGDRVREGRRRARQPDPVPAQSSREELRAKTGTTKLPTLVLGDGTVISHSRAINSWIAEHRS